MAVTTAGLTESIYLWGNESTPVEFAYIAFGTGTTAAAAGDTTLESESDREAAETLVMSTLVKDDTVRYSYEFTIATAETISEIGVLNAATGGDLLAHAILDEADRITVTVGQKVLIEHDITVKDGGYS